MIAHIRRRPRFLLMHTCRCVCFFLLSLYFLLLIYEENFFESFLPSPYKIFLLIQLVHVNFQRNTVGGHLHFFLVFLLGNRWYMFFVTTYLPCTFHFVRSYQ